MLFDHVVGPFDQGKRRLVGGVGEQVEQVDHILVTGDLTNLALESEFARARGLLEPIALYERLSIVPGNHDIYTRGSERDQRFERYFGDLMWSAETTPSEQTYPWYKDVQGVGVVGLCSARPRLPFIATGEIGKEQLKRLEKLNIYNNEGLSGPIPESVSRLTKLTLLKLGSCSLSNEDKARARDHKPASVTIFTV